MNTTVELTLEELAILQKLLINSTQSGGWRATSTMTKVKLLHKLDDAEDTLIEDAAYTKEQYNV
tara:strand:+ start:463 stop:654 length:192 start_codon:yes stop_codon:yes gene_type:complete